MVKCAKRHLTKNEVCCMYTFYPVYFISTTKSTLQSYLTGFFSTPLWLYRGIMAKNLSQGIECEVTLDKVIRLNMAQERQMKSYPNKAH